MAPAASPNASSATTRSGARGTSLSRTAVTTPRVPSLAHRIPGKKYPVLSLISPLMWDTTCPVPSTAVSPSSWARVSP